MLKPSKGIINSHTQWPSKASESHITLQPEKASDPFRPKLTRPSRLDPGHFCTIWFRPSLKNGPNKCRKSDLAYTLAISITAITKALLNRIRHIVRTNSKKEWMHEGLHERIKEWIYERGVGGGELIKVCWKHVCVRAHTHTDIYIYIYTHTHHPQQKPRKKRNKPIKNKEAKKRRNKHESLH